MGLEETGRDQSMQSRSSGMVLTTMETQGSFRQRGDLAAYLLLHFLKSFI